LTLAADRPKYLKNSFQKFQRSRFASPKCYSGCHRIGALYVSNAQKSISVGVPPRNPLRFFQALAVNGEEKEQKERTRKKGMAAIGDHE